MTPSLPECREAVRSVRRSDAGRQALRVLRPRSGFGVFRSRLPAPLLLWLRAREQRLQWSSTDAFAVLNPPLVAPSTRQAGPGRSAGRPAARAPFAVLVLRALDRHWEGVLALGPAVALLVLAALAALAATAVPSALGTLRLPVLILVLLAVTYVAFSMTAFAAYSGFQLIRSGPVPRAEAAVADVLASHWTIALLHPEGADGVDDLLELCRRRAAPAAAHDPAQRGRVAVPLLPVTSREHRDAVRGMPEARLLAETPPVVMIGRGPLPVPAGLGSPGWRDLGIFLSGTAAFLALAAASLTPLEAGLCASSGCRDGEPTSYGDMLYWLVTRVVSGGDPNGLGPSSWQLRLIGTLLTFFGLYVLVAIFGRVVDAQIHDSRQNIDELVARYNEREADDAPRPVGRRPRIRRAASGLGSALSRWGAGPASRGGQAQPDETTRGRHM